MDTARLTHGSEIVELAPCCYGVMRPDDSSFVRHEEAPGDSESTTNDDRPLLIRVR